MVTAASVVGGAWRLQRAITGLVAGVCDIPYLAKLLPFRVHVAESALARSMQDAGIAMWELPDVLHMIT